METATMGKVIVTARVESMEDLYDVYKGRLKRRKREHAEIADALVDTGASTLSLPKRLVAQFGLRPVRTRQAPSIAGPVTLQMFSTVRLTVQGCDCSCDVVEIPDDCPALIGQAPLEPLDFVVDPAGQHLIGNPVYGGEHIIELY